MTIVTVRPISQSAPTSWGTVGTATTVYEATSDQLDTTYAQTLATATHFLQTAAPGVPTDATINSVTFNARASGNTVSGDYYKRFLINGSAIDTITGNATENLTAPVGAPVVITSVAVLNPSTGLAWTGADVNGTSANGLTGVVLRAVLAGADTEANIHDIWLEIDFTPAADTFPPNWDSAPSVPVTTKTTADLTATIDEIGDIYAVVVLQSDPNPSVAQVLLGQNSTGAAAIFAGSATTTQTLAVQATGLLEDTQYKAVFAAQDLVPNVQSPVTVVNFATLATQPVIGNVNGTDIHVAGTTLTINFVAEGLLTTKIQIIDALGHVDTYEQFTTQSDAAITIAAYTPLLVPYGSDVTVRATDAASHTNDRLITLQPPAGSIFKAAVNPNTTDIGSLFADASGTPVSGWQVETQVATANSTITQISAEGFPTLAGGAGVDTISGVRYYDATAGFWSEYQTFNVTDSLATAVNVSVPVGTVTVTGSVPTVTVTPTAVEISIPAGTVTVTGSVPTVTTPGSLTIPIPAGIVTVTGSVPTVTLGSLTIPIPAGIVTVTGSVPTVTVGTVNVSIPAGTVTVTGSVPTVTVSAQGSITAGVLFRVTRRNSQVKLQ